MAVLHSQEQSRVYHWPPQGAWTYADYARLPATGDRYEVIRGDLHMSPAPRPKHQKVISRLIAAFENFLDEHPVGDVFPSPIDVRPTEEDTVVQPDIVFIAKDNLEMVQDAYIFGVPDLLVEILSPGSLNYDRRDKYHLYAEVGVPEYWIIDPERCTVTVHVLCGNAYVPLAEVGPDVVIPSEQLPDLQLPVAKICT